MLVIRESQIKALEDAAVDNFVRQLCDHCKEFSPHLCKTLTDDQLLKAVEQGVDSAKAHGFDLRGPVRFYVDLMIALGSGFDTDPQYPWIAEILGPSDENAEEEKEEHEEGEEGTSKLDQMERSEALSDRVSDYLEKVDGEDNVHTLKALKQLSERLNQGLEFRLDDFERRTMGLMKEIHPRKVEETGEEALLKLISDAKEKAQRRYGFQEARSLGLMSVLMFSFGHQCDADPFLPWIAKTLSKTDDVEADKVAEDLERRARIWLEAVLSNAKEVK